MTFRFISEHRVFTKPGETKFNINSYYRNYEGENPKQLKITIFVGNMYSGKTSKVKKYISSSFENKSRTNLYPIIINPINIRNRYLSLSDVNRSKAKRQPWYNCIIFDDLPSHDVLLEEDGIKKRLEKYRRLIHSGIEEIIIMTVPFYINCDLDIIEMNMKYLKAILKYDDSIPPIIMADEEITKPNPDFQNQIKFMDISIHKCYLKREESKYYNIPCTITSDLSYSFKPISKIGDIHKQSRTREKDNIREVITLNVEKLSQITSDLIIDDFMKHPDYENLIKNFEETEGEITDYDVLADPEELKSKLNQVNDQVDSSNSND